ncbi:MAG: SH3 domain-containing protein [Alphaproteobacteria bacterium]
MTHNLARRGLAGAVLSLLIAWSGASAVLAQSGLPVPRFASLKSDEVNLRAGPGKSYPVEWVLLRRAWPVEVIAEYEQWRRVRDIDGTLGWVHQTMLSGERTAVVQDGIQTLFAAPDAGAAPVLRVEAGVIGALLACAPDWCRLEVQGVRGWIERVHLFGVLPGETFD